jgi:AcrR family transcriptional regulator
VEDGLDGSADDTTRDRLRKVAEELFARQGYDATSVDSIARAAGVNKAMIYYYFGSKQQLAHDIFAQMQEEMAQRSAVPGGTMRDKIAAEIDFLDTRKSLLSFLLMESLKAEDQANILLDIAARLIRTDLAARGFDLPAETGQAGAGIATRVLVHEFFTGVVPIALFIALEAKFCDHFGIPRDEARAAFLDAVERSHFASHIAPDEA